MAASASSESVSVDEIKDLLTCCMCLETLHEPRSLPCFHNFYKVCLGEYILLFKNIYFAHACMGTTELGIYPYPVMSVMTEFII